MKMKPDDKDEQGGRGTPAERSPETDDTGTKLGWAKADRIARTLDNGIAAVHRVQSIQDQALGVTATVLHIYRITGTVAQRLITDANGPGGELPPVKELADAEELFRTVEIDNDSLAGLAAYYVRRATERLRLATELLDALPDGKRTH